MFPVTCPALMVSDSEMIMIMVYANIEMDTSILSKLICLVMLTSLARAPATPTILIVYHAFISVLKFCTQFSEICILYYSCTFTFLNKFLQKSNESIGNTARHL